MKKYILPILLIILISIVIILGQISFVQIKNKISSKSSLEDPSLEFAKENANTIFSIDKIIYFSSAHANTSINSNSSFTISNLYQYTDIAIFINNHSDGNYTLENTLKSLSIKDIEYSLKPSTGNPNLYYKNLNKFATSEYDENNKINSDFSFNITSEDEIDYQSPTLYNNCANPIILSYVNSNIKQDYTLNESILNISYDGSLLKHTNVTLNSIACRISMVINITNNLDETFRCPISLEIPLSTESSTIYDGTLTLKASTNYNFIR